MPDIRDRGSAATADPHMLTGAYALDALDEVENAAASRHLRECQDCAIEVAEFREVAARLAAGIAVVPPDRLKQGVLAAVAGQRQVSPDVRESRPRPRLRRPLLAAAAAAVIGATSLLGGLAWQGQREAEAERLEAARITRVLTDPDRTDVADEPSVGGQATVVAANGEAVFAASGLPAPGEDRSYQLWVIDPEPTQVIRSAGLLELRDGVTQALIEDVEPGETVAVSIEPEGGSRQPTSTPVVALAVT